MEFMSEIDFQRLKAKIHQRGYIRTDLRGTSMLPLLKDGQEVLIQKLTAELKTFDSIVFWNGKVLICHVIKHINSISKSYVTTGLLLQKEDTPVMEHQILGQATIKIPFFLKVYLTIKWKLKD